MIGWHLLRFLKNVLHQFFFPERSLVVSLVIFKLKIQMLPPDRKKKKLTVNIRATLFFCGAAGGCAAAVAAGVAAGAAAACPAWAWAATIGCPIEAAGWTSRYTVGVAKLVPVAGWAVTRRTTWAGVVIGGIELIGADGLTEGIITTRVTAGSFNAGTEVIEEREPVDATGVAGGGLLGNRPAA